MTNGNSPFFLLVGLQEAGMKLLRFLERRLQTPPPKSMLHRWIRSGQVRINGGRAKPFSPLAAGDQVRIPPFASPRHVENVDTANLAGKSGANTPLLSRGDVIEGKEGTGLLVVEITDDLLVLGKPGDLSCQPGSGHSDSVSARLAKAFADSAFIPAPAHRLDRRTTGLVLAGRSHTSQKWVHGLFHTGGIRKEYLAWVKGDWPHDSPCLLQDTLAPRNDEKGKEMICALPGGSTKELQVTGKALQLPRPFVREKKISLCLAVPVERFHIYSVKGFSSIAHPGSAARRVCSTLLLVLLLTGHKHQIRAQLASRDFPVTGDRRYGTDDFPQMLLHAYALGLPAIPGRVDVSAREYTLMPEWPAPYAPDPDTIMSARARMRAVLELCRA